MRIGVLAVQGAFIEHEQMLRKLDVETFEIRRKEDVSQPLDGLVLPGGESTVMGKLLQELGLFEPLHKQIVQGLPVLGTCAVLILLAETLSNDSHTYFGTLPVTVRRNAYGRQLGSFLKIGQIDGHEAFPMVFIRAPSIESIGADVEVLATVDGKTVGVRYKNQIGVSFHPELTRNLTFHRLFLKMIEQSKNKSEKRRFPDVEGWEKVGSD